MIEMSKKTSYMYEKFLAKSKLKGTGTVLKKMKHLQSTFSFSAVLAHQVAVWWTRNVFFRIRTERDRDPNPVRDPAGIFILYF
jgi:hypothetical protein